MHYTYLSFTLNCSIFNLQDARVCGTGHCPSQVLRWNAQYILLAMKCVQRDGVQREIENNPYSIQFESKITKIFVLGIQVKMEP